MAHLGTKGPFWNSKFPFWNSEKVAALGTKWTFWNSKFPFWNSGKSGRPWTQNAYYGFTTRGVVPGHYQAILGTAKTNDSLLQAT